MPHHHYHHRALHLEHRTPRPNPRPLPIPLDRLDFLVPRQQPNAVVERAASSTTSSSISAHSCGPNDNSGPCEKPADSGNGITLPVVLGSVIPITVAIIVLLILHRRHVKKLRLEDKNDKHKSLDFGMGDVDRTAGENGKKSKKAVPEMSITDAEKTLRRGRGMSLDIENPYLLPPGLQNSRESLHSMSRTVPGDDDRYRPATNYIPNDETRSYSPSMRRALDDSSSYTSSGRHRTQQDDMSKNLLKNAQRMSRSMPPTLEISSPSGQNISDLQEPDHAYIVDRKDLPRRPERSLDPSPTPSNRSRENNDSALRNSNMYLSKFIHSRDPSADLLAQAKEEPKPKPPLPEPEKSLPAPARSSPPPAPSALPGNPRPPRLQSMDAPILPPLHNIYPSEKNDFTINEHEFSSTQDNYTDKEHEFANQQHDNSYSTHPHDNSYPAPKNENRYSTNQQQENSYPTTQRRESLYPSANSYDMNTKRPVSGRFSLDAQNPSGQYDYSEYAYEEQEYHDNPNRRTMGFVPLPPEDPNDTPEERATRIKSFYKEYFDSSKAGQQQHYEQPYNGGYYEDYDNYEQEYHYGGGYDEANGQFVTGQNHFYEEPITRRAMTPPPRGPPRFRGPPGHMSSGSGGYMPGPRSYSSASFQHGQNRRGPPKKPIPPPQPLRTLPTPHLLKDDTFIPIDFAPPSSVRGRVAGRPESPFGISKPYSPTLPAHVPIASAFDELPVMPSPHLLRKSGTFTALDFAPPPRFKNSDSGSDAGSVRSGRSGMSTAQLHNLRAGAYRLSRIPKEVAGTRNELVASLRPQWDMNR